MKSALLARCRLLAAVVGLVVCVPWAAIPQAADGPNLIANPDFEFAGPGGGAPVGWNTSQRATGAVFSTVTEAKSAHSGTKAVAIKQTTAVRNNAGWAQTIPARPGIVYRYSFWIRTDDVRPLTAHSDVAPTASGFVGFLDSTRKNLPIEGPSLKSNPVLMTHEWTRFELSVRSPDNTAFIRVNLGLGNAVGTVYFDSVSLVESSFSRLPSPEWLADAVVYGAGPWEFAQFGGGKGLAGLRQKLPELKGLGVNMVYLLPVWENRGWYPITDHYAIFRSYGTEDDLKALVFDAHALGIRVILDLVTIGVSPQSRLLAEHKDWFVLNPDGSIYNSWGDMLGLDTNLPAVQNYFADVARYYVEKVGIDGWRNDSAAASPYHLFAKVRAAIQKVKPDAIMLAEESAAVDFETAFDMTYDFKFQTLLSKILDNPLAAAGGIRDVEASRSRFPAGAQQFRFFEWPGLDTTIPSSRCGTDCAVAFGTLLLTADGVPKINHGQEVGNTVPQRGPFVAPMNWDINPDAARYRARYQALGAIRSKYAVLRRGDFKALGSSDSRIATFARTLAGEQPIVTVINFANAAVEPKVDLSAGLSQANVRFMLVDLLDNTRIPVPDPKAFTLKLEPYKARVLQVVPDSR